MLIDKVEMKRRGRDSEKDALSAEMTVFKGLSRMMSIWLATLHGKTAEMSGQILFSLYDRSKRKKPLEQTRVTRPAVKGTKAGIVKSGTNQTMLLAAARVHSWQWGWIVLMQPRAK